MKHPNIWSEMGVPLQWGILPDSVLKQHFLQVLEARDNKEIQLMVDFDNNIWWRRDLNGEWELGL